MCPESLCAWMSSSGKERTATHSVAKGALDDSRDLLTICSTSSRHQTCSSVLGEASKLYQASLCPAHDQYPNGTATWEDAPAPGWPPLQRTSPLTETDSLLERIPFQTIPLQPKSSPLEMPMRPIPEMTPQGRGTSWRPSCSPRWPDFPVYIAERCHGG